MDLYLKAADEAAMNAALIEAGLLVKRTHSVVVGHQYGGEMYDNYSDIPHTEEVDEDGDVELIYPEGIETLWEDETFLVPAEGVSLDVIGPITRVTGYDEAGEPIVQEYPEWHVNVRCAGLTEEQEAELAGLVIVPPETPFRVWA